MEQCYCFYHKYSASDIEALKKLHTKQLLKTRDALYSGPCCGSYFSSAHPTCVECYANVKYNRQQVKDILATREHVLNKQESKTLRKQRIKEGR